MMDITIHLLDESVKEELFEFEVENRNYFAQIGFPRDKSYYDFRNFEQITKDLIFDREKDLTYLYLIKNSFGKIVGRVNLFSITRGPFNKAEIGYRIGENHQGKGYATKAVKLAVKNALDVHRFHRLEAGTSPENIGSQIVLIKNGFQFTGRQSKFIYNNGKWNDSISFEKILD